MGVSKESDVPKVLFMFQSPQWGVILKLLLSKLKYLSTCFRPLDGE